ncbi:MAG TPA: hypothetical protein VFP55_07925 [Solirubrobacteraceae bacterium]|nr:hypothetical protein [Solirubrobacteraceae bacterium]
MLSKLAIGVTAACAFTAFAAQGASAANCSSTVNPPCYTLSFNHAVLDAGGSAANIVTPSTAPLTVQATLTGSPAPGQATFTVPTNGVNFPVYNFTAGGFSGTITTTLKNTATGTLNFATGATTMAADFVSTVTLSGVPGSCDLDTGLMNLSTANTQPLMGVAFPAGTSGPVTGTGAFGGTWSSVTGTPQPSNSSTCTLLNVAGYLGSGGLWISRNLAPPSPAVTVNKIKAIKAGKTVAVHVKVSNAAGSVGTGAIKLCLKAPRHFKVLKGACRTITNVAGGKVSVVNFKVKTPKVKKAKKHGKLKAKTYKLTLTKSTTTEGLMSNAAIAKAQLIAFKVKG